MKTRNLKKKLTLNKKTIADFEITGMRGIHGGIKDPHVYTVLYDPCPDTDHCGTVTGNPCEAC